ncbi:MAG: hypothetical protein ACXADY_14165 [Candidatus Hodarchaeales archaeon]|jgi:hypothetical protein
MVDGSGFFALFFFLFFIFIIILIYYSAVKEKEFSESVKVMIEEQFPNLQTTIVSEGGFFSNPEIYASPSTNDYPIRDLLLKYKVYGSGKHRKQDLILSSQIVTEKPSKGNFSVIVKREGFFSRVFGGENVQLGHQSLDKRLFIRASNPSLVQLFLSENNFQIASKISDIYDLKECKLDLTGNSIDVIIRSDHTNVRYVGALLNLVSIIANVDSLYPNQQEGTVFRATTKRVFERIPSRKQRFKDLPRDISYEKSIDYRPEPVADDINYDITKAPTPDSVLLEKIKEKIHDKSYLAADYEIFNTSAKMTFNIGYFQDTLFNWDTKTIRMTGVKESSLMDFRIVMKEHQKKKTAIDFFDPFTGIEVNGEPKELLDSFKERTEIARFFNRLIWDSSPKVEIFSDKKTVNLSITAPARPENIDPLYDLSQSIGWFLEFSFLI